MSKDYRKALQDDLPQMFKGRANIEAFNKAVGRQLNELLDFYNQLNFDRTLKTAVGLQLDAIGDILGMTRKQAYEATDHTDAHALSDEDYRTLLAYKIMLNYGHATYYDIMRGIRRFYGANPVTYHEEVESPASFSVEIQCEEGEHIVLRNLLPIKAAGVNCSFQFRLYARIEVSTEITGYPYDLPECGTLLCGTYPATATKGHSDRTKVDVTFEYVGNEYISPFTGTVPDTATKGRSESSTVDASSGVDTGIYVSDESGMITTGTKPGTATHGNAQEAGLVAAATDLAVTDYETRITGLYPEAAETGAVIEKKAETSMAATSYITETNVCGVKYCGE